MEKGHPGLIGSEATRAGRDPLRVAACGRGQDPLELEQPPVLSGFPFNLEDGLYVYV